MQRNATNGLFPKSSKLENFGFPNIQANHPNKSLRILMNFEDIELSQKPFSRCQVLQGLAIQDLDPPAIYMDQF